MKKNSKITHLTKEQILNKCRALESALVPVDGFDGCVRMKNLTYSEIIDLRVGASGREEYQAMLIAAVCEDLSLDDAMTLQQGNGFMFLSLFEAINKYLANDLGDETVKK